MRKVTRAEMREIDRRAIFEYGIPSMVLMENAGRAVAEEVAKIAEPPAVISIVCGKGNNGGDGLVCARHLHNRGFDVAVLLLYDMADAAAENDFSKNLNIVKKMNLNIIKLGERPFPELLKRADVIVDAIFGTGLEREIKGSEKEVIDTINMSGKKVVAVDAPSGLDCNSGSPMGVCVKAYKTVTMGLPKAGFDKAKYFTGEIIVANIGIPIALLG